MRQPIVSTLVTIASILGCTVWAHAQANNDLPTPTLPTPPNFIVILTDDQGWNGMSVAMDPQRADSQSDYFLTPNLARLAAEGLRFTNGYAPAALCCPTRRSLQFGQSPVRMGDESFAAQYPTTTGRVTIPRVLKQADERYRAAHFGKWDLRSELLPEHLGYDESDGDTGNKTGNEGSSFGKQGKWQKTLITDDPKKIFSLTRRAVDFISRQVTEQRPFYLQVSHYAVHADQHARPVSLTRFQNMQPGSRHRIPGYAAMTADLDDGIGQLLDAVDRMHIADHTYIFFLSDNGGVPWVPPDGGKHFANPLTLPDKSRNYPLRSGKWTLFEGGIRVPFIIRGPDISPGAFSTHPVVGWDLLPTIADLAGHDAPLPEDLDGVSFRALLTDPQHGAAPAPERAFIFHRYSKGNPHSAIRKGRYKLIKFWHQPDDLLLFDLQDDLGETTNLASRHPERARELDEQLTSYLESVSAEILVAD